MSFISAIKNAFGFGPDNDYDIENDDDVEVSDTIEEQSTSQTAVEDKTEQPELPPMPVVDADMKARIYDGAVAIFNRSLPDFIKQSIDADAQAKLLADAIDKGVDDYLNGLVAKAESYAEAKLRTAAEGARRESERLRADLQQIEQQRTSLREQQLSADRRRRALDERVKDLESQLEKVEAEREQYQLENRSLLNKLKVADIQPGVVEEMSKEIESLKAQLASGAPAPVEVPADAVSAADLEAAKAEVESVRADLEAARTEVGSAKAAIEEANAKCKVAETEAERAKTEVEAAKAEAQQAVSELQDIRTQQEMSQSMYNDMQNQFAAERESRLAAEKSLQEAKEIIDSVSELQLQMTKVEELIRKRDDKIAKLKQSNKRLREQLAAAEETARHAVQHDDGLFSLPVENEEPSKDRFSVDDMTAIEDEFECPDWFVSEPLPGEVSPLLSSDADFGYQEPPKKVRKPESDAQLSLF